MWAFNSSVGCNQVPPSGLDTNCTFIDATTNSYLDSREGDEVMTSVPFLSEDYSFFMFKAYTPISKGNIHTIVWNWTGDTYLDPNHDILYYVWNETNTSYSFYNYRDNVSVSKFNWTISSSATNDLINSSNFLHLLVITNDSSLSVADDTRIETDFVELTIYYYTSTVIGLKYPSNNSYSNKNINYFACNYTDDTTLKNATLYLYNSDLTLNSTNSTTISGISNSTNRSMTMSDGLYKWNCQNFNIDNVSSFGENNFTITIDTTNPEIYFGEGTEIDYQNISRKSIYVNISVTETNEKNVTFFLYDTGGLVNSTTYPNGRRTINWTSLSDGVYYYNFTVLDKANNSNSSSTRTITLDTTNPLITIKKPLNTTYTENISTLNYSYSDTNPKSCWYSRTNGVVNLTILSAGTNFSSVTSVEGENNWTLYCNDTAGNLNSSIVHFFKDTVFPQVKIVSPSNGTNSSDYGLDVNYTYFDTNLASCWWTNTSGISNNTIVCGTNITNQRWAEGLNTIKVYVNDTLGNTNVSNVTFNIDTTGPSITFISPTYYQSVTYASNITFDVSVADLGGVSACWYSNSSGTTNYSVSCNTQFNITEKQDGTYNLTFWSNDTLNNIGKGVTYYVISMDSPAVTLNYPLNGQYFKNYHLYFNFTANDSNGIDVCKLYTNTSGNWENNYTWISPNSGIMNYTQLNISSDGDYIYNIWCNDTTNKESFGTINFTFTTDTVYPYLDVTSISTTAGSQNIRFNFTFTELHPSVCWYALLNSSSGYEKSNTTLGCYDNSTLVTLSDYGTYSLYIYMNDSAGNENWTREAFSIEEASSTVTILGGGGPTFPTEITVIALKQVPNKDILSNLSRAILYSRIREACNQTLSCKLDSYDKIGLRQVLEGNSTNISLSYLDDWIRQYNNNQIETVIVSESDVLNYNLFTGALSIQESGFVVTPKVLDSFTIILFTRTFKYQTKSNLELKNASVVSGELGLSVELTSTTTANVILEVQNTDFSAKLMKGTINYISTDGKSTFQEVNLRVINLTDFRTQLALVMVIIIPVGYYFYRKKLKLKKLKLSLYNA